MKQPQTKRVPSKTAAVQIDPKYYYQRAKHYENTPIQIYWKFHHQKLKIFR